MKDIRYFSLGRHALRSGLLLADVSEGDAVLVPSFICRDVLSSINSLQATPIFYEVDQGLRPVFLDQSIRAKAVIAVNYFGFPQDLDVFVEFSEQTGARIVEDNAHGFLSEDTNGTSLGTRTDLGITCFRKSLHVQDGAILHFSSLEHDLPRQLEFAQRRLELRTTLLSMMSQVDRKFHLQLVIWAQQVSRLIRKVITNSPLPRSLDQSEHLIPGLANPHQSSIVKLDNLNRLQEINRRRKLYMNLLPRVMAIGATPIFSELPIGTCPYGIAVYAYNTQLRDLGRLARQFHVTLMQWPDLPSQVIETAPSHYRRVWLLNFQ